MDWPGNLPPIRIIREGDREPRPMPSPRRQVRAISKAMPKIGAIEPTLGTVSFFLQGRWWCEKCGVMWAGSWEVRDIAPYTRQGDDWAPVHDCGTVMERTSGDERADAN